jgi:tetratricopeptide (TPR) repeat protein
VIPIRILALLLAGLLSLPAAAKSPLETGQEQFASGRYRDAVATLRAAAGEEAGDARLAFWLARSHYELREWESAVKSAERAVQLDTGNSEYHLWLARAYGRQAEHSGPFSAFGKARKARDTWQKAIQLDPANLGARRDYITFLLEAPGIIGGGDDKALAQIEELARRDPVEGHLARAEYWQELKKPERAEEEYRKALALKPKAAPAYFEVADFYLKRGNAAAMEETVEAAARVNSRDPRLAFYRGAVRVLAGNRPAEAEQFLKSYISTVPPREDRPSHAGAHEWLGRLYEKLGRRDDAAREYRAALTLQPKRKSASQALKALQQ